MADNDDRRETILKTLYALLKDVPNVVEVRRNDLSIPEKRRPAIIMLDGDELASQAAFDRGRPTTGPNLVSMMPEIYLLVSSQPDTVGPELNALRRRVRKAIMTNEQLVALVHNRDIRYEGCETGLAAGRSMEGEMRLNFTFTYVDKP